MKIHPMVILKAIFIDPDSILSAIIKTNKNISIIKIIISPIRVNFY